MVQLSTRYDTTLKKKVFVLKGEEAYARTTDVLVDIVSDFADCNTHLGSARVGLEIDILREIGDGFIYIYNNDDLIFEPIPWNSSNMATIIDSDWNDKGVYWSDNKLKIGTSSDTDTGIRLAYDVEHNIKVHYSGNKQCLASTSDVLKFVMPTPDLFTSTLTLTSPSSNRYDSGATINNLSLLYQSSSVSANKSVKIYVDGTLNTTVTCTTGTASTVNIGTLSDGLHTIRAIFEGDEYSTYAETTLDISVGYEVLLTDYPSVVIPNVEESLTCRLIDYLGNGVNHATVRVVEYSNGSYNNITYADVYSDGNGYATFDVSEENGVAFTGKPSYVKVGSTVYTQIPYELVNISSVTLLTNPNQLVSNSTYITKGNTLRISGYCSDSNGKLDKKGIPVTITYNNQSKTVYTNSDGNFAFDYVGTAAGYVEMTIAVASVSKTIVVEDLIQYWVSKKTNPSDMSYLTPYSDLTQLNNGYRLTPTSSVVGSGLLRLDNIQQYDIVQLEFDVLSVTGGKLHVNYQSFDITRGHVDISMDFKNHWLEVFVDGDNVVSGTNNHFNLSFGMNYPTYVDNNSMVFNNLKLRKYVEDD